MWISFLQVWISFLKGINKTLKNGKKIGYFGDPVELNKTIFFFVGIEISDVLKIDDKDYSITFSLYFNVQWYEPRLNLSQEFFDSENITTDEQLVPGKSLKNSIFSSPKL